MDVEAKAKRLGDEGRTGEAAKMKDIEKDSKISNLTDTLKGKIVSIENIKGD